MAAGFAIIKHTDTGLQKNDCSTKASPFYRLISLTRTFLVHTQHLNISMQSLSQFTHIIAFTCHYASTI